MGTPQADPVPLPTVDDILFPEPEWFEVNGSAIAVFPLPVRWAVPFYGALRRGGADDYYKATGFSLMANGHDPSEAVTWGTRAKDGSCVVADYVALQKQVNAEHNEKARLVGQGIFQEPDENGEQGDPPSVSPLVSAFARARGLDPLAAASAYTASQIIVLALIVDADAAGQGRGARPAGTREPRSVREAREQGIRHVRLPANWKETMTPESYEQFLAGAMSAGLPKKGDVVG